MKQSTLLLVLLLCATLVFGINPNKEYFLTPKDLQLKYEESQIKTVDNYTLNLWHIMPHANTTERTIIISYGDAGNMQQCLNVAHALAEKGFNIWLYDYRGFGKSDDFEMNLDQLYYIEFVNDLSAVVDRAKSTNPETKICLFGLSMGTIINALYYHEHSNNVDFFIGEGLVYSAENVADRIKEMSGKTIMLPHLDVRLEQIYASMQIPILLFFASEDIVCNNDDIAMLRQRKGKMEIINYEGGHLAGMSVLGAPLYTQYIAFFLNNMK